MKAQHSLLRYNLSRNFNFQVKSLLLRISACSYPSLCLTHSYRVAISQLSINELSFGQTTPTNVAKIVPITTRQNSWKFKYTPLTLVIEHYTLLIGCIFCIKDFLQPLLKQETTEMVGGLAVRAAPARKSILDDIWDFSKCYDERLQYINR